MFEYEKLNNLDILVYCGGKCGSSTLHSTFKNNGYVSYKVHDSAYFNYLCNTFKKDTDKTIFDVIDFNIQNDTPIYIIDSYRTPIERKMSAFFQNLGKRINNYNQKTTEDIISIFNQSFLYKLEEYHSIDEVMKHYGLPTFTNFDFKNKYNIVKKDNITEENIGEIMLCQIPGISSVTALTIMEKYKYLPNLVKCLQEDPDCLNGISTTDAKGKSRKISKTTIATIVKYLGNKN